MSEERRRRLLFGFLVSLLALGALAVTLLTDDDAMAPVPAVEKGGSRAPEEAAIDPVAGDLAREVAEHEARGEARGEAHRDGPITEEQAALEERVRAETEAVAREFFASFSLFEIGELSGVVAAGIRATATPDYARELLRGPPRLPATGEIPERGEIVGRLTLAPLEGGGGEFRRVELVGELERGGELSTIAFELTHSDVGWRVSGLGE